LSQPIKHKHTPETKQGGLELLRHQKEEAVEGKHGDTIFDEDIITRVQEFVDNKIQEGVIKP